MATTMHPLQIIYGSWYPVKPDGENDGVAASMPFRQLGYAGRRDVPADPVIIVPARPPARLAILMDCWYTVIGLEANI
ncbi:hypothetical protein Hamer_G029511 [Homarus americanus]|uniref:Uncharacterized protein n=1 Tax=Homarus americanus TaxID=6706 RepID=A0A8J5MWI2_HOMAM|nr:hypothetical protein Hamer_G029511 [Homarus americanus]